MTDPEKPDDSTPAAATPEGAPAKSHGDPLLAASQGATEGTEGSRHGYDATSAARSED